MDGTVTPHSPSEGNSTFSLKELQEVVGGFIELVNDLPHGQVMVVNEDGRMLQLGLNDKASQIAGRMILGNVLVMDSNQIN